MKRWRTKACLGLLLAALLLTLAAPGAWAAVPDRPENQYVLDDAGVLSASTEREIVKENQRMFEEYGAEVVIVAVDFFGGEDREDYANDIFNHWGIGSRERNNGLLLVLGIGEEDYYATAGSGIDDYFDGARLDDLLYEYLEPDFAAGDYDAGVKKFFAQVVKELDSYYASVPNPNHPAYSDEGYRENEAQNNSFNAGRVVGKIIFFLVRAAIVVAVFLLVVNLLRRSRGGGGGSGGGGGGFWPGLFVGSMMGRRRTHWHHHNHWGPPPPPPPPPPPGGFGPGPRPGGPRPPRPPRPGGGFGGFSGGGRPGGGAGRGGFGGGGRSGGFHGGGGTHGGGAGRR